METVKEVVAPMPSLQYSPSNGSPAALLGISPVTISRMTAIVRRVVRPRETWDEFLQIFVAMSRRMQNKSGAQCTAYILLSEAACHPTQLYLLLPITLNSMRCEYSDNWNIDNHKSWNENNDDVVERLATNLLWWITLIFQEEFESWRFRKCQKSYD